MNAPVDATGATDRARRIWITVAVVVGIVVAIELVAQGLDRAVGGSEPRGRTGSAYATAPGGLAAFASLLTRYGAAVEIRNQSISSDPPPDGATAVVLEPSVLDAADTDALTAFVSRGGRLIAGGAQPFYLRNLSTKPPEWSPRGSTSWTRVDAPLAPLREIATAGTGSWSAPGRGSVVVGSTGDALVTRERVGRGEIFFVADVSPLENAYLGTADDAAFALALALPSGRGDTVVFPEAVHGYGASRGLAAIPTQWKLALALLAFAALVFVWSRARRFGAPDRDARALPPARAEYVRSLSVSLERTHDRARALGPAQEWARARVAERAGLGPAATPDETARAAMRAFGCTPAEAAALLGPPGDPQAELMLGRALARVAGSGANAGREDGPNGSER